MNAKDDSLLTLADVARIANVSEVTVYRWKNRGQLAYVQLPGGDLRFRRETLDALLEEKTHLQDLPTHRAGRVREGARQHRTKQLLAAAKQGA